MKKENAAAMGFVLILICAVLLLLHFCTAEERTSAKPVLYLYPQARQTVTVRLSYDGTLTHTAPAYKEGWQVTADPDGTLTNLADGKTYPYLFWEGTEHSARWDLSKGYVVKGSGTAAFLKDTLSKMGLLPKEYNAFIAYWLPQMKNNRYNLITFQTVAYEKLAKLTVSPKPDAELRIFMAYQALEKPITVKAPAITPFTRRGFTVVEWGGTRLS